MHSLAADVPSLDVVDGSEALRQSSSPSGKIITSKHLFQVRIFVLIDEKVTLLVYSTGANDETGTRQ